MSAEQLLLIGTYTKPEVHVPGGCGEGVVTCALDLATGQIERRSVYGNIQNPSYLAADPDSQYVFAVSEKISSAGEVYQFQLSAEGKLLPVAKQPTHGAATCHVCVLPGDRVCAASYVGGCLDIYPLFKGELMPANRVFYYQGQGMNPQRQEASHAHQAVVAPEGKWFYVCDLGADCVWQHDLAAEMPPVRWPMPPGQGPRHAVFHSTLPLLYVLGEMTGAVSVCDWDARTGALKVVSTTGTLGDDASAAAIRLHPSGRTLWISVRKTPSLMAFSIDESGRLSKTAEIKLAAGEPRDFAISPDGRWLVSANQSANELAIVELNPVTGLPVNSGMGRFAVNTPVSVLFLPTLP